MNQIGKFDHANLLGQRGSFGEFENVKFKEGSLRFCEWNGLWKATTDSAPVSRDEYERVFHVFADFCRRMFQQNPKFSHDFYIRGDYTGDRSQVVEINQPKILNLEFIASLQKWLREDDYSDWRIVIPTYLTKNEVIVVYPEAIKISAAYERDLKEGLVAISERMKNYGDG